MTPLSYEIHTQKGTPIWGVFRQAPSPRIRGRVRRPAISGALSLLAELWAFRGAAPPSDDMACVVVRVQDA